MAAGTDPGPTARTDPGPASRPGTGPHGAGPHGSGQHGSVPHGSGPQDARALYDFGYACVEGGVGYLAVRPLARALEL